MQNTFISYITCVLYFITGALLAIRLFRQKGMQSTNPLFSKAAAISFGFMSVALHAVLLYQILLVPTGLDLGVYNAISLITWLIALTLLLAIITNPIESLGILIMPFAGISVLLGNFFHVEHTILVAQAMKLKLHIIMSILAYSLLSIAAVHALVLALQEYQLRHKKPGGFVRALPPLQTMETLLFQMIGLGFFLHSLSLITGIIYLDDMFAQHIAHKTILSIIAWFIFAILLWGRWRFGWRGSTAIRWTLVGFAVLFLAYVGSKWVLEVILSR